MVESCGSSREQQGGECWQFAQWLRHHWQIAAVTAQFAEK
jgi:hypothetical protein